MLSFLTGSLGNFPLEDFDFSGDLDVEDFSGVFDRDLDENLLFRFFASFFFFHVWGDSLTFNCGGRAGPWTTPSSSLSPPKLVINSTFVFLGSSGEQERDLDDEDLL